MTTGGNIIERLRRLGRDDAHELDELLDDEDIPHSAREAIRAWGGVLEHPAESRAFAFHGLPRPIFGAWQRTIDGDWVTEVNQAAYGHRARKRTWLVYHGDTTPADLDWSPATGTMQIGRFDKLREVMGKAEALATPPRFRDALLKLAEAA